MGKQEFVIHRTASVEERVDAIQSAFDERGMSPAQSLDELQHLAEEAWSANGKRVVARAWSDPQFRKRLLADGTSAIAELGLPMPKHHRHLVVLANDAAGQTVICCTL